MRFTKEQVREEKEKAVDRALVSRTNLTVVYVLMGVIFGMFFGFYLPKIIMPLADLLAEGK